MEKKKKKSILSCINGYKFSTIMSPITVALEVVMEILIPLVMSDIINIIDFNNKHEAGATLKLTLLKFLSDVPSQKAAIIAGLLYYHLALESYREFFQLRHHVVLLKIYVRKSIIQFRISLLQTLISFQHQA